MSVIRIPFDRFSRKSRLVFFTGAGISAESGISTFRDVDGYWSKYDPMELASAVGFQRNPDLVLDWYATRRKAIRTAQPNAGHFAITKFQKLFPSCVVITQNVDGLHARAGNDPVWELHGNIHRQKCFSCGKMVKATRRIKSKVEYCSCGGMLRPDVVWFGESLPENILNDSYETVSACDIFFSIGTSTQVFPAAQLPYKAQEKGAFVIEINPESTPFSSKADLSLRESAGIALPKMYEEFHDSLQ